MRCASGKSRVRRSVGGEWAFSPVDGSSERVSLAAAQKKNNVLLHSFIHDIQYSYTCGEGEDSGFGVQNISTSHSHYVDLIHNQTTQCDTDYIIFHHHRALSVIVYCGNVGEREDRAGEVIKVIVWPHGGQLHPPDGDLEKWAEPRSQHLP